MTNLELAICEAENAGEIDLDTRDMMLDVLNESTAQAKTVEKVRKEMRDLHDKELRLLEMKKKFEAEGNEKMAKAAEDKAREINDKRCELFVKREKIDPKHLAGGASVAGKRAARYKERNNTMYDYELRTGKESVSKNPWRGNSKRKERKPGRYKTTSGLKESVLEEIYEAELCGDITPEERMALIDYMDM